MHCDYSAIVRGRDEDGKRFEEIVKVRNLSACGAYFQINRNLHTGQMVTVRIAFPTGSLTYGSSKVTIRAVVIRVEPLSDELLQIGIKFLNFRFL
ncbi:MAG: hypothetical protein HPY85_07225 [Anaerolineae bacterium]|nr:hypothetical protein [Anaerolineae bacterium]